MKEVNVQDWNRFVREGFNTDEAVSDLFVADWKKMCRDYGLAFIEFCGALWVCECDRMTQKEFSVAFGIPLDKAGNLPSIILNYSIIPGL